jgi:hypothetical protein
LSFATLRQTDYYMAHVLSGQNWHENIVNPAAIAHIMADLSRHGAHVVMTDIDGAVMSDLP